MKLATKDTHHLLDDLTSILLALRLLRDRTPLSMEQAELVAHALGSARDLERLAVAGIVGQEQDAAAVSHEEARAQLGDELDAPPNAREQGPLAAHLEACPPCHAFGRTLKSTQSLLRQLPRVHMPEAARKNLQQLISTALTTSARPRRPEAAKRSSTLTGSRQSESASSS